MRCRNNSVVKDGESSRPSQASRPSQTSRPSQAGISTMKDDVSYTPKDVAILIRIVVVYCFDIKLCYVLFFS